MPFYDHLCQSCNQEFEDFYSAVDPIPTTCPLCHAEGQIKRLISLGGKGKVRKSGAELREHIAEESAKVAKEYQTNENFRANIMGEGKYHQGYRPVVSQFSGPFRKK